MNARATPPSNQVPSKMQVVTNDQVPMNPLAMTNGEVREVLFQISQYITTQDQAITVQANREVPPQENQYASTMDGRLRDYM